MSIESGISNSTEVPCVSSIPGIRHMTGDGWFRRDAIIMGGDEIGAVHVREQHGRINSLSQAGDAYVMGRDVEWIVQRSGRLPIPEIPTHEPIAATLAPRRHTL